MELNEISSATGYSGTALEITTLSFEGQIQSHGLASQFEHNDWISMLEQVEVVRFALMLVQAFQDAILHEVQLEVF